MTIDQLLEKWLGTEGGAERANYQMFLTELAEALHLPRPHPKGMGLGDYEFEAPVKSEAVYGGKGTKRIDLYKRDCFILEAKQSQVKEGEAPPDDPADEPHTETEFDLFGAPVRTIAKAGKPRRRYDRLMEDARLQAQRYALALPDDHATPPFLIVADIGRAFELYFDFAGNGRGYRPFPDERGYRIALEDLASDAAIDGVDKTAADTLRAIWTGPESIDPRTRAAEVTREVAERLSRVAKHLEDTTRKQNPGAHDEALSLGIEETSLFVMRLLFCMFAEDVELLPKGKFTALLVDAREVLDADAQTGAIHWRNALEDLWRMMDQPGEPRPYWLFGKKLVRHFNGNLFREKRVYPLASEFLGELIVAAQKEWKNVEPAIFGTLLEQVLTASERAKLGAHYTPRPYVQRLVQATMMDVLEAEWAAVLEDARAALDTPAPSPSHAFGAGPSLSRKGRGDSEPAPSPLAGEGSTREAREGEGAAIALACAFHERLANLRVLDPACGTGNFLYVAMENLLRLESEVRQFVIGLGGELEPKVHPNQFLGLELNPRAAVIAELVLWIGWLRFRLANTPEGIGDPVLPTLDNINFGRHPSHYDAVLVRDEANEPDTDNPRRPEWPEADFIVGNPPFIGGKDIRDRLGGAYAEALWKANPRVPKSADFVMQWWDRAADILTRPHTRLRRFGFVTTNSITQVFSRRVIEGWLAPPRDGEGDRAKRGGGDSPPDAALEASPLHQPAAGPPPRAGEDKLHLVLAIPDHPWTRVGDGAAAVRIAMTVAEAGPGEGKLIEIVGEAGLDTDEPELEEREESGRINADLSVGTDVTQVVPLKANAPFSARGVEFHADGYVLTNEEHSRLSSEAPEFYKRYVKPYVALADYKSGRLNRWVADLFGLTESEFRRAAPELYQRLLRLAYPKRKNNTVQFRRENWWMLALPHTELREGLSAISNAIFTPITSRYRWFVRDDSRQLPDQNLGNYILYLAGRESLHRPRDGNTEAFWRTMPPPMSLS